MNLADFLNDESEWNGAGVLRLELNIMLTRLVLSRQPPADPGPTRWTSFPPVVRAPLRDSCATVRAELTGDLTALIPFHSSMLNSLRRAL